MIRLATVAFLALVSSPIALTAGCGGATTEPGDERPNEDRRPVGPSVPTNGSLTAAPDGASMEKGLGHILRRTRSYAVRPLRRLHETLRER